MKAEPLAAQNDHAVAQICKALSSPVRIAILRYVLAHPGCIGNQILLHLPDDGPHAQSTVSQHLRQLREAGLLEAHSDGTAVCYYLCPERVRWLQHALGAIAVT